MAINDNNNTIVTPPERNFRQRYEEVGYPPPGVGDIPGDSDESQILLTTTGGGVNGRINYRLSAVGAQTDPVSDAIMRSLWRGWDVAINENTTNSTKDIPAQEGLRLQLEYQFPANDLIDTFTVDFDDSTNVAVTLATGAISNFNSSGLSAGEPIRIEGVVAADGASAATIAVVDAMNSTELTVAAFVASDASPARIILDLAKSTATLGDIDVTNARIYYPAHEFWYGADGFRPWFSAWSANGAVKAGGHLSKLPILINMTAPNGDDDFINAGNQQPAFYSYANRAVGYAAFKGHNTSAKGVWTTLISGSHTLHVGMDFYNSGADTWGIWNGSNITRFIINDATGNVGIGDIGPHNSVPDAENLALPTATLHVCGTLGVVAKTIILGVGATTFAITSSVQIVDGDAGGNTIGTITGGVTGTLLTLIFVDASVTITDTDDATANTVNLSAAFTSAENTTLTLVHNGTKWLETARSVNG